MTFLLCVPAAFALAVNIRAEVSADLRVIRGVMTLDERTALVDPLPALPAPPDDRTLFRTFPGAPDTGTVTWSTLDDGAIRFEARLPVRYGDLGVLPRDGLWANGGWYPQPVGEGGEARVADWDVRVSAPAGAALILGGAVGEGELGWRGTADRAPLAVVPRARVTELPVRGGVVRLVERNASERALHKLLPAIVEEAWPLLEPPDLVVVEDLDLLHLARAGPSTVFLSDRAFRLSPGFLRPYHVDAVRRAVAAAALQGRRAAFADGWRRDFGAAALVGALPAPSARKLLGWFSWNPVIDALLYDGTLPYFADIFDEPFGGPAGLYESLGGRIPGRAAAAQVDDLLGEGTADKLTKLLLVGTPWDEALAAFGVPAALADAWRRPYRADQDYRLDVRPDGARVIREAPADAPAEVVRLVVDGEPRAPWLAGPGPAELPIGPRPTNIQVDPQGHTLQDNLANDRWPVRWTVVVNGGLYNINPSQHSFDLAGDILLRRQNDSRNVLVAGVEHDDQDLVSVDLGWVHWLGPLVDRRTRVHRLSFFAGPSLLDPAFRPTDRGAVALGGSASYTWDTRTDKNFALSGHRLALGVGGGFVPESTDRWASASVLGVVLLSPHPRHVFALKGKAGWASGDVEHRLLPLGGGNDVRAVPAAEVVGNVRIDGTIEYRSAPLRNASIPLPLLWLSDIHVSPGLDVGAAWRGETLHATVGAALGVHVLTDFLGAQSNLTGVTVALPLWTHGFEASEPQVYIDFAHPF